MGKPGDYYLNTKTFDLYGPKTKKGWDTPVNLKGTANVMYSAWFDFQANLINRSDFISMYIVESRMTDGFLNTGTLHVYAKDEDSNLKTILSLPYRQGDNLLQFLALNGLIDLDGDGQKEDFSGLIIRAENTASGFITLSVSQFKFRYVLIPGAVAIDRASGFSIDWSNYEEVKRYLGLREGKQLIYK